MTPLLYSFVSCRRCKSGRIGIPHDVAASIRWLRDEAQSGWMVAQVIGTDSDLGTIRSCFS